MIVDEHERKERDMRAFLAAGAALLAIAPAMATTPTLTGNAAGDEAQIAQTLRDGCKATVARDVDGMMAPFEKSDHLVMFDFGTPRTRDYPSLRAADAEFAKTVKGTPFCEYLEIHPVILSADSAYSWAVLRAGGTLANGQKMDLTMRSTDIWRKIGSTWKIVHEHNSFPVDMATGKPDLQSRP
jgi:ketosteroid isomerase-like protein